MKRSSTSHILGKIPPQATELEEVVLGAIMIESGSYNKVSDIIRPESFYLPAHTEIYKAICTLSTKSCAIDIMTVSAELRSNGNLDMVGGAYYITNLTSRVSSSANIIDHARIIEQKFVQRELIRVCSETISNAYDDTTDIFELVEDHQSKVYESVKSTYGRNDVSIAEAVAERLQAYETTSSSELTGVGTGFQTLDSFTGGWQPSDLVVIAARPAMGKTAFAIETAKKAAINHKISVGIFSLEMSTKQLTDRLISSESGILQDKIRKRNLTTEDFSKIHKTIGPLIQSKIQIDDTPALSIQALKSKAIRMKEKYNIGLLVVDYLQLMSGAMDKKGNREQEIGNISRGLKVIAKELDIPVIALSQLSREVERRSDKRPMLSDLRESGSIEQDADQVIFLYRPEYYGEMIDEEGRSNVGVCELIFGKNRNGICDIVPLKFNGSLMRFSDHQQNTSDYLTTKINDNSIF